MLTRCAYLKSLECAVDGHHGIHRPPRRTEHHENRDDVDLKRILISVSLPSGTYRVSDHVHHEQIHRETLDRSERHVPRSFREQVLMLLFRVASVIHLKLYG